MPADGQVHAISTNDGYDLRLGLWAVPGFKIEIMEPKTAQAGDPPASTPSEEAHDDSGDNSDSPPEGAPDAKDAGEADISPGENRTDSKAESDSEQTPDSAAKVEDDGKAEKDGAAEEAPETPTQDSVRPNKVKTADDDPKPALADTRNTEPDSEDKGADSSIPETRPSEAPESVSPSSDPIGADAQETDEAATKPKTRSAASSDPVMVGNEPPAPADDESDAKSATGAETAPEGASSDPDPAEKATAEAGDERATIPAGTIILLKGRCEFIEKYFEVIGELIDRGFCVAALDWRGQGGSERLIKGNPRKGHIDDMDSYVEDLVSLLDFLETTNCPKPYFCLAHSTGGQVLIRAAPIIADRVTRAVTTAPFLEFARYRLSKPFIFGLASTLTYAGLGELYAPGTGRKPPCSEPFEGNVLSADRRRYERTAALVNTHDELAIGGPTISWVYAALKSAREIGTLAFLSRIRLPILMLTASEDKVVSSKAAVELAIVARTISQLSVPGARHEILMERDEIREQFWAAFDAFIPGGD